MRARLLQQPLCPQVKSLEVELKSLVSQEVITQEQLVVLGMTVQQVETLMSREVEDISQAVTFTLESSRVAYEALHNFM